MSYLELTARSRQLFRGPLKHVRNAALAAALVPLGSVALPDSARAQENTSRVDATVTPEGSGFRYDFTVFNTSSGGVATSAAAAGELPTPVIIDWELPLFDLGDIDVSSIESPSGWSYEIVTPPYNSVNGNIWTAYDPATDPLLDPLQGGDPDLYGPNPEAFDNPPFVLHWYNVCCGSGGAGPIFPGQFLSGFSFESEYSSKNAPYMASWEFFPPRGGDPPIPGSGFGSPNSPARMAAQGIPEPSTFVLLAMAGSALVAVGGTSRIRE